MWKFLQPVSHQLYSQFYRINDIPLRSRSILKQHFLCYGSDSPPWNPESDGLSDLNTLRVDDDDVPSNSELSDRTKGYQMIIQRKQQPLPGDVPIRMTLSSTNKMLFGPLMETSQEKKRRLKREAKGIDENKRSKKNNKKSREKNKGKLTVEPLIQNSANSHYFLTDQQKYMSNSSIKENSESTNGNFPHKSSETHNVLTPNKKKLEVLKSNTDILVWSNFEERTYSRSSSRKKIIVVSRNNKTLKETQTCGNTSSIVNSENVNEIPMSQSANEYQYVADINRSEVASFLTVDNSKFTAVPQSLDIKEMESFPLFSNVFHENLSNYKEKVDRNNDIISIGIFDGGYQKLPSVRKILEETMPLSNRIALERWKAKMLKELGEEGFNQYRKGLLDRGKFLHECIQVELSGAGLESDHTLTVKELWRSVRQVLPNVSDVNVLESRLIHPYLYYQGAVDCIASYRGTPVLIEWKTSSKPKLSVKSMFDDPLQVVAYLGALNFDSNYRLPQSIESAMLVVAYESGLPAHVHILNKDDCQHYWRIWCSRLCQFWKQQELVKNQLE